MAEECTKSRMIGRPSLAVKGIVALLSVRAMAGDYDMINTGVYTMPPTPTSHGSGYTPDGTTTGFTTDPPATFAHLSSPLRINVPSETTALSVLSPGMSPACAATSGAPTGLASTRLAALELGIRLAHFSAAVVHARHTP